MNREILNNSQWAKIEHLLPGKNTDCGVTAKDNRAFIEAVLWIARTGAPWRDLPERYGAWYTVYTRYYRWAKKGVWQRIFKAFADAGDIEFLLVDGSIVRVHQHGSAKKKTAMQRAKVVRGVA